MKTLIIFLFLMWSTTCVEAPSPITTVLLPPITVEADGYNREIFNSALEYGADSATARLLVAQARLESGGFTNKLTRDHNNVFSMQHPSRRKTTSVCACASAEKRKNRYASYRSVNEAVADLFLYFEAKKITPRQLSTNTYVKILKKKHFFEEDEKVYRVNLKKHLKTITL
jgi:uncharacterized FlgJ-related protein